ncbi:MAG: hypothetical protein Tsb0034_02440 [Ekhidna sp.]
MSGDKDHSAQFEKYLKGQMSPAEANDFERSILDDPFAEEALEGLETHHPEALRDIPSLKRRIKQASRGNTYWLKVAASIVLLLAAGVSAYLIQFQSPSGEPIAMENEADVAMDSSAMVERVPDSTSGSQLAESIPDEEIADQNDPPITTAEESNTEVQADLQEQSIEANEPEVLQETTAQQDDLLLAEESVNVADESEEMNASAGASAVTARPQLAQADEVVADEKRKKAETAAPQPAAARSRSMAAEPTKADASPAVGPVAYQRYLQQNLNYPQQAIDAQIEGIVKLSIVVSATGDIKVLGVDDSVGYGCDGEAIRLVREGPKWTPAKIGNRNVADTTSVIVRFELNN